MNLYVFTNYSIFQTFCRDHNILNACDYKLRTKAEACICIIIANNINNKFDFPDLSSTVCPT